MKNLSDRIAENKKQNPSSKGQNKAIFHSLKNEISSALQDGWNAKDIWETLNAEGKITFGYDMFSRYVRRYIKEANTVGKQQQLQKTKAADGFAFNPSPKQEELV